MAIVEKQLAQLFVSNTSAQVIYSPPDGVTAIIKEIDIVNNDGTATHDVLIFHDEDGTTANQFVLIYRDSAVPSLMTRELKNKWIPMRNPNGSISVQVADGTPAVTFTLYGVEIS